MERRLTPIDNLKLTLEHQYKRQIINYFGDDKRALKFLSGVISAVQKTPKLLECDSTSLLNSFMTMAQLELMPSDVSGEAYVLPYKNIAQFQLGYQGLVTLFYRAGVKSIAAEIVYKNDGFKYVNGVVEHTPDFFSDNRGEAIGAYVIVELQQGGKVSKVMSAKEIMAIGQKFSKSFKTDFTPWKTANDPERWMWKKTVLKQVAKLVPKNETIFRAISEDNKDSIISDRIAKAQEESSGLKMGNLIKPNNKPNEKNNPPKKEEIEEELPIINVEEEEIDIDAVPTSESN